MLISRPARARAQAITLIIRGRTRSTITQTRDDSYRVLSPSSLSQRPATLCYIAREPVVMALAGGLTGWLAASTNGHREFLQTANGKCRFLTMAFFLFSNNEDLPRVVCCVQSTIESHGGP